MSERARTSPALVALAWANPALCAAAALVVVAGAVVGLAQPAGDPVTSSAGPALLLRTVGVALLIGLCATLLAVPAAWTLRGARGAGAGWWGLLAAPMLLPSYLIYAAWSTLRAPGTLVGDWLMQSSPGVVQWVGKAQAVGALALWAWPIAALVLAARFMRISEGALEADRLYALSRFARAGAALRASAGGFVYATLVVALLMLGSAVPLHLAQVETHAIEVWRLLAESPSPGPAWRASLPLVVVALGAGVLLGGMLTRSGRDGESRSAPPTRPPHHPRSLGALAVVIWALSTLVPIALFLASLREGASLLKFWRGGADALLTSAAVAFAVGALAVVVAYSAAASASLGRSAHARAGVVSGGALRAWLALALAPGVLVGASVLWAARLPGAAWLADTSAGVVLAHVARFGFVAALLGVWVAASEPAGLRDERALARSWSLSRWLRSFSLAQRMAIAASGVAVAVLSLHEIEATVVAAPPGGQNLAQQLLGQLHYLRVEEFSAAAAQLMGIGVLLALACALVCAAGLRAASRAAAVLLLCLTLTGCDRSTGAAGDKNKPIDAVATLGGVGRSPGQFIRPRVIDADADSLWIIDKTGRVQRLSHDGEPLTEWLMPLRDDGLPTGATVGPGGNLYVADTHENRVLVFGREGDVVREWGGYGRGDGQFIYPTDVAIATEADGVTPRRIYVSEYGDNDRVSVFDADANFLFAFGSYGSSPSAVDVRFARPQSLLYLAERDELLVADSSNHRVGRFSADGELLAWFGGVDVAPDDPPGGFRYPYGLARLPDGTVLVSEFGGNRVQRIDAVSGATLAVYGRAGRGEGELAQPWGVAAAGRTAFVLDTENHRVIVFKPGAPRGLFAQSGAGSAAGKGGAQ